MIKLSGVILSTLLIAATSGLHAEPVVGDPPAHQQKKAVPDTTSSGDYLEHQDQGTKGNKHKHDGATPSNAQQKGERFKTDPEKGGTEVKQK